MTHEEMPDWDDDIDESVGQAFVESMPHDDISAILRDVTRFADLEELEQAADRLDRYRELLMRARIVVPSAFLKDIDEALK
jgi:hypothetical protein